MKGDSPRQSLALLVRILAAHGYDDKLAGHVSVRDRDDETLLVTPLGVFWREVSARDLLRVDRDGELVEGEGRVNPTIIFHAELHRARPGHPRGAPQPSSFRKHLGRRGRSCRRSSTRPERTGAEGR